MERCERGGMRGISIGQLRDFNQFFEAFLCQRNMYYVASNIVRPLTKPMNLSVTELMGAGPTDYFVTHLWTGAFIDLVDSLTKHSQEREAAQAHIDNKQHFSPEWRAFRYWICSFSTNQFAIQDEFGNGNLSEASSFLAMNSSSCKGTCVVFGNPTVFTHIFHRIWCVFEVHYSLFRGGCESADYERIFFCTPSGALSQCGSDFVLVCVERLRAINMRHDVECSCVQDKILLTHMIEQNGGWDALAEAVHSCLEYSLMSMRQQVDSGVMMQRHASHEAAFQKTLGSVVRCDPGPHRAISAGQLQELQRSFESILAGRDMYWLCDYIVKPLTQSEGISFAELVGCGELNWFISHWWGMHFKRTVESVAKHAQGDRYAGNWETTRYWICTFSNNQWAMDQEIPPEAAPSESSFYKALRWRSCRGTCMVLDERVVPLTRAWCLFELLQTFIIQDEAKHKREDLSILTSSGVLNSGKCSIDTAMAIGQKLTTLDLQNASASKPEDQHLIFSAVENSGGFDAINSKLRHNIQMVISTVASRFDHDLQHLHAQLNNQIATDHFSV